MASSSVGVHSSRIVSAGQRKLGVQQSLCGHWAPEAAVPDVLISALSGGCAALARCPRAYTCGESSASSSLSDIAQDGSLTMSWDKATLP